MKTPAKSGSVKGGAKAAASATKVVADDKAKRPVKSAVSAAKSVAPAKGRVAAGDGKALKTPTKAPGGNPGVYD
ncbi:MAG: hypothetical protein FWB78_09605, partial [Treponema sp.]|nr:hypothetical protein [Treponema sp.]